jgi:hypothetical protein
VHAGDDYIQYGGSARLLNTPTRAPVTSRPAPPAAAPPTTADTHNGATAQCNDGTLSYSAHRRGTCSHHGGVAIWF